MIDSDLLKTRLTNAWLARRDLIDPDHQGALRLFNGFLEGQPELALELYARTLVIYDYADNPQAGAAQVQAARDWASRRLDWLGCMLVKTRRSPSLEERRGRVLWGGSPARRVREAGIWYALDLQMNQDSSLYLDTRWLRDWLRQNSAGKSLLNAFAYTGSLGIAALAGGAARVLQVDLNRRFLNLAKESYTLNGFPIHKADFIAQDFWSAAARLRRAGVSFDLAVLDPPFFSATPKGTLDLVNDSARLINKIRPLVKHGGRLVAINNALFLSGAEYLQSLESLCAGGYLEIESLLPVPPDFTGFPGTRLGSPPVDPAPFNHPTKIAVLRVFAKQAG